MKHMRLFSLTLTGVQAQDGQLTARLCYSILLLLGLDNQARLNTSQCEPTK